MKALLIGFEQEAWDDQLAALLRDVQPGGVIFFNRNTRRGPDVFRDLVTRVHEALGEDAILAADVEGGGVDRLRGLLGPTPAARDVAARCDPQATRAFGAEIAERLRRFGLNTNFAPVLDLAHPVLGDRAVSDCPGDIVRFARAFLAGLKDQGITGCGKHFPGLGSAPLDTHQALAVVTKGAEDLWEEDLYPYFELAGELPMVMLSHAAYPALGADGPASMSPAIVRLLRERVGFRGTVVSDDLEMGAALQGRTIGEAAVAALRAGCQLLPVCRREENIRAAHQALWEAECSSPV